MWKYDKARFLETYTNRQSKMDSKRPKLYCPLSVNFFFGFSSLSFEKWWSEIFRKINKTIVNIAKC